MISVCMLHSRPSLKLYLEKDTDPPQAAKVNTRRRTMPAGYAEERNMVFHKTVVVAALLGHENHN